MPASARTVSLTEHQQRFLDAQVAPVVAAARAKWFGEALRRYEDDVLREHFVCKVEVDILLLLAVTHDAMTSELHTRVQEGEAA